MSDVNLKFNKPELNVTIDREKQSLGISVIDIAQTLQLSLADSVLVIS
jgi:HAE1 family hydrophobic/amphiphilic exporter-1/multidrug efflux pump